MGLTPHARRGDWDGEVSPAGAPRRRVCEAAQETHADQPLQPAPHLARPGPQETRRGRLRRLRLGPGDERRRVAGGAAGTEPAAGGGAVNAATSTPSPVRTRGADPI